MKSEPILYVAFDLWLGNWPWWENLQEVGEGGHIVKEQVWREILEADNVSFSSERKQDRVEEEWLKFETEAKSLRSFKKLGIGW